MTKYNMAMSFIIGALKDRNVDNVHIFKYKVNMFQWNPFMYLEEITH